MSYHIFCIKIRQHYFFDFYNLRQLSSIRTYSYCSLSINKRLTALTAYLTWNIDPDVVSSATVETVALVADHLALNNWTSLTGRSNPDKSHIVKEKVSHWISVLAQLLRQRDTTEEGSLIWGAEMLRINAVHNCHFCALKCKLNSWMTFICMTYILTIFKGEYINLMIRTEIF